MMNPKSASALVWFSGALVVVALSALSPSFSFVLLVLAVVCAAAPAVFGSRKTRLFAVGLLVVSGLTMVKGFNQFNGERNAQQQRLQDKRP